MDLASMDTTTLAVVGTAGTAALTAIARVLAKVATVLADGAERLVVRSIRFMDHLETELERLSAAVEAQNKMFEVRADALGKALDERATSLDAHLQSITETIKTRDLS